MSVISAIRTYIRTYSELKDDAPVWVNFLSETPEGYSIVPLTGDRIVLGTRPVSGRTLAHEFGHLLGFSDAYVRGYDGSPEDPYGVVLVEWTGLTNDLMGSPGGGKVSDEMMRTLIETYGDSSVDEVFD